MSSYYEPTVVSNASCCSAAEEPIICPDFNCTYPYGSACQNCAREFDARAAAAAAREQEKEKAAARHGYGCDDDYDYDCGLEEESSEVPPPSPPSREAAVAQEAVERNHRRRRGDIAERVANVVEDLQAIFFFTPPPTPPPPQRAPPPPPRDPKPKTPNQQTTPKHSHTPDSTARAPLPSHAAASGSRSGNPTTRLTEGPRRMLDAWVDEVARNTRDAIARGILFAGGADDGDSEEAVHNAECPYCLGSMGHGAWRELHMIKCRYAHEEAQKLRKVKAVAARRRKLVG
ncbi:hypothetical protein DSL72_007151 [Monilinia vaccinii-corymbosi]|uniref:Uncharacterized protein n=1 Tax=Monilinia vaccinii-corymbosi TaxID=61207 RepID=A0A8A3PKU1_9HELO|nr:hypothetical protein DSL72_007151 [Monilinia vaccinii-corymbosi]